MFVSFMKISACWLLHRLIKLSKKNFRKADGWPPPSQPQLLLRQCCFVRVICFPCLRVEGFVNFQSKPTVHDSSIFDRFRTDDLWLVNLSLVRISFGEFVLKGFLFCLTPAPLWSLGTLLSHGFLNLATARQVTSFTHAPKISDPVVRFSHDLLVIRDHLCEKKREPIATANSLKSIVETCWFLQKVDFNEICWEKRPVKPRPNLRTSFCRRDLKNTQPHLKLWFLSGKIVALRLQY